MIVNFSSVSFPRYMIHDYDSNLSTVHTILPISCRRITQNVCNDTHGDRKFSTSHIKVKCWYTQWPKVFHTTQNVCRRITRWPEVFHITQKVKCWYTQLPEVFHSTQKVKCWYTVIRSCLQYTESQMLVHTVSRIFPQHTQCLFTKHTVFWSF